MNKMFKTVSVIFISLVFCLFSGISAFAVESMIDYDALGSITLSVKDSTLGEVIPFEFEIYRVAEIVPDRDGIKYIPVSYFVEGGFDLSDLTAPKLTTEIYRFIEANSLPAFQKGTLIDKSTKFVDLEVGLYLIAQVGQMEGYYPISPFFVAIPMRNADGTGLIYDIDASPKPGVWKTTDIKVKKVWKLSSGESIMPDFIAVKLFCGDDLVDTVILNEENNWSYVWKDMPLKDDYRVVEIVPEDFKASYERDKFEFTITNVDKLPNSGHDFTNIILFAVAGIFALSLGWILVRTGSGDND